MNDVLLEALVVAVAGGTGAALRHLADRSATRRWGPGQVRGILAVNLVGSFVAGLLVGVTHDGTLLRTTGLALLGGFTTFSTAVVQTLALAAEESGVPARGVAQAVGTALGAVAAAALGLAAGGVVGGGG